MAGTPAAQIGSQTLKGMMSSGSATVQLGDRPACRVGDREISGGRVAPRGDPTVFIENRPAARVTDPILGGQGKQIAAGVRTVVVGAVKGGGVTTKREEVMDLYFIGKSADPPDPGARALQLVKYTWPQAVTVVTVDDLVETALAIIGSRKIRTLNFADHATYPATYDASYSQLSQLSQLVGRDEVPTKLPPAMEASLARLRPHFARHGEVNLHGCFLGRNVVLLTRLARIFGVPVRAGYFEQQAITPELDAPVITCDGKRCQTDIDGAFAKRPPAPAPAPQLDLRSLHVDLRGPQDTRRPLVDMREGL